MVVTDKYTMGSALFCGTPKGYGNWSYELYSKKDSEWEKICKKYGEEDKSKLNKESNDESGTDTN